jgi:hypothetical protein
MSKARTSRRTSRHLGAPKRLARVARLLARPSRRSWRRDPAATHLSPFSEVGGPFRSTLLWILRSHAARPLRPFRQARRREPAVICPEPPVVASTQFCGRRQSRRPGRPGYRNRGEPIAPLAGPGRPKRSCRRSSPTIAIPSVPRPDATDVAASRCRRSASKLGTGENMNAIVRAMRIRRSRLAETGASGATRSTNPPGGMAVARDRRCALPD